MIVRKEAPTYTAPAAPLSGHSQPTKFPYILFLLSTLLSLPFFSPPSTHFCPFTRYVRSSYT